MLILQQLVLRNAEKEHNTYQTIPPQAYPSGGTEKHTRKSSWHCPDVLAQLIGVTDEIALPTHLAAS